MTKPNTPSAAEALKRLLSIMAALRTPQTGCPWDLEQTFETIAPYTIEEAYEVADAISRGDLADLKEELGDLLLQVVYHARIAEEKGAFAFADVAFWSRIKAEEKADRAAERARLSPEASGQTTGLGSLTLADVPLGLPALTRAVKLQDKAAKVGFDWPDLGPVFQKMKEEIGELEEVAFASAPSAGSPESLTQAQRAATEEELGDMLFVMANIARHLKLDPETALRAANDKFTRRFAYIERRLAERGKTAPQSTLEEMDALWDEVRALDKERRG